MGQVCETAFAPSIVPTDRTVSEFPISCQRIVFEAGRCWPNDTAKVVARITGRDPRSYYRWKAGKTTPKGPDIIALARAIRDDYAARGRMFEQFLLKL